MGVFREDSRLLEIELRSSDRAKLTFSDPVHSNKSLYYEGTIKWQFDEGIATFSSIMTGKGKLYFPNGDIYEGGVLNGKMHTGP